MSRDEFIGKAQTMVDGLFWASAGSRPDPANGLNIVELSPDRVGRYERLIVDVPSLLQDQSRKAPNSAHAMNWARLAKLYQRQSGVSLPFACQLPIFAETGWYYLFLLVSIPGEIQYVGLKTKYEPPIY